MCFTLLVLISLVFIAPIIRQLNYPDLYDELRYYQNQYQDFFEKDPEYLTPDDYIRVAETYLEIDSMKDLNRFFKKLENAPHNILKKQELYNKLGEYLRAYKYQSIDVLSTFYSMSVEEQIRFFYPHETKIYVDRKYARVEQFVAALHNIIDQCALYESFPYQTNPSFSKETDAVPDYYATDASIFLGKHPNSIPSYYLLKYQETKIRVFPTSSLEAFQNTLPQAPLSDRKIAFSYGI